MKLEICDIKKKWDTAEIQFSANVESGKMLVIAGHSGSGKSTVLRMISGLVPCESGKILLDGKDITAEKPSKRSVGMVFQSHALFPHMTVLENVAYGLRCRGIKKKSALEHAYDLLQSFSFTEMDAFVKRYPDEISGGEAQRVSIARTLIVKPAVVLFDEPFSSLDVPLRKKLMAEIENLQNETGFIGIFVTHDINEAKTVADVITVMKNGKQVWNGLPEEFGEHLL